ncbi:integral membrane protein [Aspergillus costaricaensis CBS 115574]|uniref:Integral membrane protein n=1 Tax=Aspergillus costaricaensis CBS 115574 TaxID=1448317 RepID=A0ACD1I3G7_9EURO|nr:integral membrane protein [Aspergillus costaricaensis CBS 115574]RAK84832.1 integral membrane protein [Aspergillus costaricaensis CBS 115574]
MAETEAPFETLSDDNHGPLITLVSVALLIVAIIFVAAKLCSVLYFKQRRSAVHTPVWLALTLLVVEVIVIQKGVDSGIGRHIDSLSDTAIQTASKYLYAAQLLHVIVLSLSEISTTLLVWKLTPHRGIRQTCRITVIFVAAWTVFAIFGIAFQCEMPDPWLYSSSHCAGKGSILYPISIIHIITELVIVVIPFFMMRNVQLTLTTRVKILAAFSARIIVLALAIAHLALLPSYLLSTDITWTIVNPTICQQAMTCSTVAIVCLPTLYHIFAGLHSGLITTRLPDEVELKHTHPYGQNSTLGSHGSKGKGPTELATIDSVVSVKRKSTIKRSSFSDSTKCLTDGDKGGGVLMTVDITVKVEDR